MFHDHWGFVSEPFPRQYDPRAYFLGLEQEEGLARLLYLVEQGRQGGLVRGPAGVGKSHLLRHLAHSLAELAVQVHQVDASGLDGHELVWRVSETFGLTPSPHDMSLQLWTRLGDLLYGTGQLSQRVVLLIDHFDRAEYGSAIALRRLTDVIRQHRAPVTVVLAVGDDALPPNAKWLYDWADLQVELTPWTTQRCDEFLHAAFERCGRRTSVLTVGAVERLAALSHGIPAELCRLAEMALLAGTGEDAAIIGPQTVDAVARELVPASDTASHPIPA